MTATMLNLMVVVVVMSVLGSHVAHAASWHLVWADEFNGHALNDHDWDYDTGCNGWGNNELQCYTAHRTQNVRVEGGHLVVDVHVENYQGKHFSSGRLRSKHAWTYGKFEARAKLTSGHHLWPAIWMLPHTNHYGVWAASGEIDIMELRGDKPHEVMGTIHYGGTWPNNVYHGSGEKHFAADFSHDFHTFAVEWDHNAIKWFVDGHEYHQENINKMMWSGRGPNPYHHNGQPFDQPFHWVLNVAVGGNFFGGGPYVTADQAKHWPKHSMEIDYVRVYQLK